MDPHASEVLIAALVLLLLSASVGTWVALVARKARRGAILDYEPRRPVPWGAAAGLLVVLFVALTVAGNVSAEQVEQQAKLDPSESLAQLLSMIVFQVLIVGGVLLIVAVVSNARGRDLGLPTSMSELGRDMRIGIVAWLACLAPVQGIQILLLGLLGNLEDPPSHPLVKMVTEGGSNISLLLAASVMAAIVAPLTEEIMFRLMLQGWLEKWEDVWVGWRREPTIETPIGDVMLEPVVQAPDYMPLMTFDKEAADESQVEAPEPLVPPSRGVLGLPYGWVPIFLSSLLFAAAHYGHGPDPIPIFVLALILGYVYQRTHRIVPTIVTHVLFNGLAMVILWQMIFFQAK